MITENLGALQRRFTLSLAKLIVHIYDSGFEASVAESYRSDEQAELNALTDAGRIRVALLTKGEFPSLAAAIKASTSHGIKASVHRNRLAQDLNLFKNGVFLTSSIDYKQFGDWWKALNPEARWGGDWGDSDHFSFEFNGVK